MNNLTDSSSGETQRDTADIDFKDIRRAFYTKFSLRNRKSLRPHREEGEVLGGKYDFDVWRNVSEHCLVAGSFAELLAENMGLLPEQIRDVTEAAILHDWYKKHETLARKKMQTANDVRSLVAAIKVTDQQKLKERGYSQKIVQLTGANFPDSMNGPQTDEEKIIWYVDAMLSDTEPVPIDQRFIALENHPMRGQLNRDFSNSYNEVYGMSLYDLQRKIGKEVGAYIAQRIGYDGDVSALPLYLKSLLIEKMHLENT